MKFTALNKVQSWDGTRCYLRKLWPAPAPFMESFTITHMNNMNAMNSNNSDSSFRVCKDNFFIIL